MSSSVVDWVPVRTAAKQLRVSRQWVYVLVLTGRLAGRTVDGTVLISEGSVQAYAKARRKSRRWPDGDR